MAAWNKTARTTGAAAAIALMAGGLLSATGTAYAQAYPSRPVRVIVPFPPGSAPDQIMRFVTQHMAQTAGQPFIMDNRPGANGNIGVEVAARATPDGYTLVSANNTTFAGNVSLYKKLPFDIQKDFTPVARFITTGLLLVVRNDLPAKDLREFIAFAKSRQGKLTAGQASAGMRVSIGMMRSLAGAELLEVSYKGTPQAVTDVIGGQIDSTFSDFAAGLQLVRAGKMRALGVTTAKRSPTLPDVPAIGEVVPGYDVTVWAGLAAPAGVPKPIIDQLWMLSSKALADEGVRKSLNSLSFSVEPMNPVEFAAYVRSETQRWAKMVKDAAIEPE
ncbi:MAG: Bug family tripartite tricarboxylate transporter substrate binding protein [bacterium]